MGKEDELAPVIDFSAWETVGNIGDHSRGEHIVTTYVSKIMMLDSYCMSGECDSSTRIFSVTLDDSRSFYVTPKTYDFIKERMYKGTPVKIEEVICVERV